MIFIPQFLKSAPSAYFSSWRQSSPEGDSCSSRKTSNTISHTIVMKGLTPSPKPNARLPPTHSQVGVLF